MSNEKANNKKLNEFKKLIPRSGKYCIHIDDEIRRDRWFVNYLRHMITLRRPCCTKENPLS